MLILFIAQVLFVVSLDFIRSITSDPEVRFLGLVSSIHCMFYCCLLHSLKQSDCRQCIHLLVGPAVVYHFLRSLVPLTVLVPVIVLVLFIVTSLFT